MGKIYSHASIAMLHDSAGTLLECARHYTCAYRNKLKI